MLCSTVICSNFRRYFCDSAHTSALRDNHMRSHREIISTAISFCDETVEKIFNRRRRRRKMNKIMSYDCKLCIFFFVGQNKMKTINVRWKAGSWFYSFGRFENKRYVFILMTNTLLSISPSLFLCLSKWNVEKRIYRHETPLIAYIHDILIGTRLLAVQHSFFFYSSFFITGPGYSFNIFFFFF